MSDRHRPVRHYPKFAQLDGSHPLQEQADDACVLYQVRRRRDAKVAYFNFALAKEMGLIDRDHPHRLNPKLSGAILDAFALVIINEHDRQNGVEWPKQAVKPYPYMATRYLQIQHPGRQGKTSGDGRSIWNGCFKHRGLTWDVSSCGTGVTRLCPATASTGEFFATGSALADYSCGTATLEEGLGAALMSEILHRNGVATERVLALLRLPGGQAIHVRAHRNLLRPSHLFTPLKQNSWKRLRQLVDLAIDRETASGRWPKRRGAGKYRHFAHAVAMDLARAVACFESEYLFVWLDWDGDNILLDGSIIDYGSVRQFGLFHRDYRFDDGPRYSTTLTEQRRKCRRIVQNLAQMSDFLIRGERRPLADFQRDPLLQAFDRHFAGHRRRLLLGKIGFARGLAEQLLERASPEVHEFERIHRRLERARSSFGPEHVPDGITWNAIYCTRDLLRELPERIRNQTSPLSAEEFYEIALSSYATAKDRELTQARRRNARRFQQAYRDLLFQAAALSECKPEAMLQRILPRARQINRKDRCTGDSLTHATRYLLKAERRLASASFHRVVESFVRSQDRNPDLSLREYRNSLQPRRKAAKKALEHLCSLQYEYCHSL